MRSTLRQRQEGWVRSLGVGYGTILHLDDTAAAAAGARPVFEDLLEGLRNVGVGGRWAVGPWMSPGSFHSSDDVLIVCSASTIDVRVDDPGGEIAWRVVSPWRPSVDPSELLLPAAGRTDPLDGEAEETYSIWLIRNDALGPTPGDDPIRLLDAYLTGDEPDRHPSANWGSMSNGFAFCGQAPTDADPQSALWSGNTIACATLDPAGLLWSLADLGGWADPSELALFPFGDGAPAVAGAASWDNTQGLVYAPADIPTSSPPRRIRESRHLCGPSAGEDVVLGCRIRWAGVDDLVVHRAADLLEDEEALTALAGSAPHPARVARLLAERLPAGMSGLVEVGPAGMR